MRSKIQLKANRHVAWQVGIDAGLEGDELEMCARSVREPIEVTYDVSETGDTKIVAINGRKVGK